MEIIRQPKTKPLNDKKKTLFSIKNHKKTNLYSNHHTFTVNNEAKVELSNHHENNNKDNEPKGQ